MQLTGGVIKTVQNWQQRTERKHERQRDKVPGVAQLKDDCTMRDELRCVYRPSQREESLRGL